MPEQISFIGRCCWGEGGGGGVRWRCSNCSFGSLGFTTVPWKVTAYTRDEPLRNKSLLSVISGKTERKVRKLVIKEVFQCLNHNKAAI